MLKNIFHLNHCTYGHVESRTLANLQGPRVIFNGLTGPKIVFHFQVEVNTVWGFKHPHRSKSEGLWSTLVELYLKNSLSVDIYCCEVFSFFCSGAVTPVVCRIIWDTPLIWGKAYMKFKTCFRLQWKNYRQSLLVCDFPIKKKWWKQNWVIYSKDRKSIWNYKK
jgi:hypothetical protein